MDHRQTLTDIIRLNLDTAEYLPAALKNTEDSPLRSTPTDGGSRAVGSHSDPTVAAATRRRPNHERRTIDTALRDLLDSTKRYHDAIEKAAETTGLCKMCSTSRIIAPPYGICRGCLATVDRARRRAAEKHKPFNRADYIAIRHTALLNRAATTTKGTL